MTERITSAEVAGMGRWIEGDGYNTIRPDWFYDLADQMEVDAIELESLTNSTEIFIKCLDRAGRMWNEAHPDKPLTTPDGAKNIVWLLEKVEALEAERDALAAKVKEYEAVAQAIYPLVESDPQLCNHPVVERLRRVLSGKEAPTC